MGNVNGQSNPCAAANLQIRPNDYSTRVELEIHRGE